MFWILLVLLIVSRAAFVIPVTLAHNRYSDNKLSMREMGTIWWAGLMRGAVSGRGELGWVAGYMTLMGWLG